MPLTLHPLTPADAHSWTKIRYLAYLGPTHKVLHHNATSPLSPNTLHKAALDNAKNFANPHFWAWKVVDTDLAPSEEDPQENGGRSIAVGIYEMKFNDIEGTGSRKEGGGEGGKEKEKPFIPPELNLPALLALLTPLREAQAEIMAEHARYLFLGTLVTHPEHQGRGAARMLLDLGIKRADEEGLDLYLSATKVGREIYERRGFELLRECWFDRGEWGGEGVDWHGCMIRRKRKGDESEVL